MAVMRTQKPGTPGRKRIMLKQAATVLLAMCLALNYEGCGRSAKDNEAKEDRISEDLEEKDLIELDSEKVLFSHSFEKNENDILKTDAVMGAAGLAKAGTTLCLDDDRTMFVDKTKLFGSADNGNESKDKLFDEKNQYQISDFHHTYGRKTCGSRI